MIVIQTEQYRTPDGKIDFPFTYVFDGSGLTDGSNYLDVQKPMQGDSDFLLRSILGVPLVATKFNYKNPSRQYANGNTSTGIIMPNTWVVLPEKLYARDRSVYFDLFNVQRVKANNACGDSPIAYASFIGFQGVKRFDRHAIDLYDTPYDYRVLPQSYAYDLTVSGAYASNGSSSPPVRQYQAMDRYDFQLLGITIAQTGQTAPVLTNDFAITLYDSKQHQLSDHPLPLTWINMARSSPSAAAPYQAVWPTPPIVYPGGSTIMFDVQSLLCSSQTPQEYNVVFHGLWRLPK